MTGRVQGNFYTMQVNGFIPFYALVMIIAQPQLQQRFGKMMA